MIKILFAFAAIFGLFFLGIKAGRKLTGRQTLDLTKLVLYSIMCAVLTISVLISIVVIF